VNRPKREPSIHQSGSEVVLASIFIVITIGSIWTRGSIPIDTIHVDIAQVGITQVGISQDFNNTIQDSPDERRRMN
jgi:hypothetical protein